MLTMGTGVIERRRAVNTATDEVCIGRASI
jgi:hypothetical protein